MNYKDIRVTGTNSIDTVADEIHRLKNRIEELEEAVKIFKDIASRSNLIACRLADGGSDEMAEILSLAKLFDRANIKFHGTQKKE